MLEVLAGIGIVLLGGVVVLQVLLLQKSGRIDFSLILDRFNLAEQKREQLERTLREEISRNREETAKESSRFRNELNSSLKNFSDSIVGTMGKMGNLQQEQFKLFSEHLDRLTQTNEERLERVRGVVEQKLKELQEDNSRKLEEMRKTVDEKLQGTLEKRLAESFKTVGDWLEKVHKGLGEMQELAGEVGDLKKVFSNVKTRGTWGEFQLGTILEEILTPEQYETNVAVKEENEERVEFAVKLPGKNNEERPVWLPIDVKFPREDYERLVEASENADAAGMENASRDLVNRVKTFAQDIHDKYISPPDTTHFAIMYLPSEGLYAEIVRKPGLVEELQRKYRVNVAGPTTITALLNSLQMGFRTLAIQKRSSEVWQILGAVKTEFDKFGEVLKALKKKIQQAANTIEKAQTRTRVMSRRLKEVETLPETEAQKMLGLEVSSEMELETFSENDSE